jgi:putative Ca2+/H+ antiporter (TMEM165/GDT1 family)
VFLVNGIATVLKLGDRTQMGAVLLATSLVAMLQLIAAALVWTIAAHGTAGRRDRGRWPAWCRSRSGRWWPTWCRWCC